MTKQSGLTCPLLTTCSPACTAYPPAGVLYSTVVSFRFLSARQFHQRIETYRPAAKKTGVHLSVHCLGDFASGKFTGGIFGRRRFCLHCLFVSQCGGFVLEPAWIPTGRVGEFGDKFAHHLHHPHGGNAVVV